MIIKKIIGVILLLSPFLVGLFFLIKNIGFKETWDYYIKPILIGLFMGCLIAMPILVGTVLLTGCSSEESRTIEIPVPMKCPKPKPMPIPHDYLADLTPMSTAPDFVKACIATRDSCMTSVEYCKKIFD